MTKIELLTAVGMVSSAGQRFGFNPLALDGCADNLVVPSDTKWPRSNLQWCLEVEDDSKFVIEIHCISPHAERGPVDHLDVRAGTGICARR